MRTQKQAQGCKSCAHRIHIGIAKREDPCICEERRAEGCCPICAAAAPICSGEQKHYNNLRRWTGESLRRA